MTIWYIFYIFLLKGGLFVMRILLGVIFVIVAGILLFIGVRDKMALDEDPPLPALTIALGLSLLYFAYRLFS